ncbi:MAG: ketoacyl-ACP synthase III [Actinomycetota bacterium]|nr:ketoacyl-ACP synthase III [Actinomycetota bacterium]
MKLGTGAKGARIVGLGDYRPHRVVTNDEIAQMVDTSDEWIRTRVGIRQRHFAGEGESLTDMAVAASGKALAASGLGPEDIDLLIMATCTAPSPIPGVGPTIAHRLGMKAPGAYDLNAACAGFCYALSSASDAIRTGSARRVLVIGAERLTDWVNPLHRGTSILFGDGAGAAVVVGTDDPGIGPVVWGSDGAKREAIIVHDRSTLMEMDGQGVFRWATTKLAPVARECCERAGVDLADIDVFVPHQANLRIIDALVRALGLQHAAIGRDIIETGNTSSASIPLALTRMLERGEAKSGDLALVLGFGAGLTYAGQVLRCP